MLRLKRTLCLLLAVVAMSACSPEEWIVTYFGDDAPTAIEVARCESGLNPDAVSPGGGNHGLFQINNVHRASFEAVTGQPWSARYNPAYNSMFAKHLYDSSGWRPWSCRP